LPIYFKTGTTMTAVVDYAAPMMRIENIMKEMHNSLLEKDMSAAHHQALILIVEARVLCNTLVLMQEKESEHALRQQAPTLQEGI
jgi:hypothetical protein